MRKKYRNRISIFGRKEIELGAKANETASVKDAVKKLKRYLDLVSIQYVEEN